MRRSCGSGGYVKVARYRETLRTNRPVSRCCFSIVERGFATIPYPPLHRGLLPAFFRHGGIYRSDVAFTLGRGPAFRWSGPGQVGEHAGRNMSCPSFAMSSDRLFLDRVARQHGPSPLHRQAQTNMHFLTPRAKGDISTLPAGGHFYFALTPRTARIDTPPVSRRQFVRRAADRRAATVGQNASSFCAAASPTMGDG